jgi:hypothetical protein
MSQYNSEYWVTKWQTNAKLKEDDVAVPLNGQKKCGILVKKEKKLA